MVLEFRSVVAPLSASFVALPATTLNVIGFPVPAANAPLEPVAEAVIVTGPTTLPVTVNVATPATAVLEPRPVTLPPPIFVLANVTLSVLSAPVATVLPFVS